MSTLSDATTTLAALKEQCAAFRDARDWKQFHNPKDLALALSVEAAELLELFRFKSAEETERDLQDMAGRQALSDEMADILYFLLMLGDHAGVDLSAALAHKMEQNERKYPVAQAYGRNVKYTQLQAEAGV